MYVKDVKDGKRAYTHIFVENRSNTPCCMLHAACSVQNNVKDVKDIKTSQNRFLTDFLKFISLLSEMSKMYTNYNIDSNTKSSNYSKIQFEPLIYFELQQSSNSNFELRPLQIRYQLNALQIGGTLN